MREILRGTALLDRRRDGAGGPHRSWPTGLASDVDLAGALEDLPLADRQLVEIARALLTEPRDARARRAHLGPANRPTPSNLLAIVEALRDRGTGVVFVSHILEEVLSVGRRGDDPARRVGSSSREHRARLS